MSYCVLPLWSRACVTEGTFQWNNDRPLKRIDIVYSVNSKVKLKYASET